MHQTIYSIIILNNNNNNTKQQPQQPSYKESELYNKQRMLMSKQKSWEDDVFFSFRSILFVPEASDEKKTRNQQQKISIRRGNGITMNQQHWKPPLTTDLNFMRQDSEDGSGQQIELQETDDDDDNNKNNDEEEEEDDDYDSPIHTNDSDASSLSNSVECCFGFKKKNLKKKKKQQCDPA
jgi:hypothetical protein